MLYISWGLMIGTSFQIGKNKTYTIWTAASSYYVRNSPKWLLCPTNLVCWSSQIPKISWSSTTRPKMAVTPPPCHEFTKSCKNSSHLQDGILDGQPSHIPFTLLLLRVDVIFVSQISILAIVPFLGTIITHVVTIWKLAAWKSDIKITRALLLWYFFNGQWAATKRGP